MTDLADRLVQAAAAAVSASYLPELLMPPDEFTAECKVAVASTLRTLADELETAFLVHKDTVVDRFRELAVEIENGDDDG